MGTDNCKQINLLLVNGVNTPQALTDTLTNIGAEVDTAGYNKGLIWIDINIGDSTDVTLVALAETSIDGDVMEWEYPILSVNATQSGVEGNAYVWTTDEDQKTILEIGLEGLIQKIQFQVKAAANQTTGTIDHLYVHWI